MRWVIVAGSHSIVLICGLAGGYYVADLEEQGARLACSLAETAHYSAFSEIQLGEGTDASREELLRGYLGILEKRKGHWTLWWRERTYAWDSAMTNARLSALASKRRAESEARYYMGQAVSFCPRIGWEDCSAERILEVVHRLDKRGLFGERRTDPSESTVANPVPSEAVRQ